MFETGIHRWLQTFDAPPIEYVMRGISVFGEEAFLAFIILAAIFGVERRRGFLLTQTLLWTTIVTSALKDLLALPRPVDVDALVRDIAGERTSPTPYTDRGAASFWGLPPADVVAYFRALPVHMSFGFPSGHCSATVAVTGSAAILWRKSWLLAFAILMFVLMPLSRMYLGRHFLADVLGGLLLGLVAVLVLILIVRDAPTLRSGRMYAALRACILFVAPFAGAVFLPGASANEAAMLLGINIGQALAVRMLPPEHIPGAGKRILAILIAAGSLIAVVALTRIAVPPAPGMVATTTGLAGRILAPCCAILAGSAYAARSRPEVTRIP